MGIEFRDRTGRLLFEATRVGAPIPKDMVALGALDRKSVEDWLRTLYAMREDMLAAERAANRMMLDCYLGKTPCLTSSPANFQVQP